MDSPIFSKANSPKPALLPLMNRCRSAVAAIAAVITLGVVNASAGDDIPKRVIKRTPDSAKVPAVKKTAVAVKKAPRFWQRSADQPCDSSACRPFRFAWSPVAPGA